MRIMRQTKFKLISLIIIISLVSLDQIFKNIALTFLKPVGKIEFIPGIIHFQWLTNDGAAWGIFKDNKIMLVLLPMIVISIIIALIFFNKIKDNFLIIIISVILSGGIGNILDRIFFGVKLFEGEVIDYLEFSFFQFPVFNFADMCVSIGAVVFCIYIMFFQEKRLKKNNSVKNEDEINNINSSLK